MRFLKNEPFKFKFERDTYLTVAIINLINLFNNKIVSELQQRLGLCEVNQYGLPG